MSASWVESLRELRAEYLRRSPERLAEIESLLRRAAEDPGNAEVLDALRLRFHSIAGTAATFGFSGATEPARAAEALLEETRARRKPLSSGALDGLEGALARLRALFEPESAREPEGAPGASRVLALTADPGEAAFLAAVLESGGHVVKVCASAANLGADARAFRPDLLLVDSELPGVAEHDFAHLVNQDETRATLPVVFLATAGQGDPPGAPADAEGHLRLVRPLAPGLLLATVTARLDRARPGATRQRPA